MDRAKMDFAMFQANGCSPEALAQHEAFLKTRPGDAQGRLDLKVIP